MYRIYYINFGYYALDTFRGISLAVAYAKSKCFECAIVDDTNNTVATWSPIGGLRTV